jgi:hypothetical protein
MHRSHRKTLPLHRLARMDQPSRRPRDHPGVAASRDWRDWLCFGFAVLCIVFAFWALGMVGPV